MSIISLDTLRKHVVDDDALGIFTSSLSPKIIVFTQNCIRGQQPGNYIELQQVSENCMTPCHQIKNVSKYNLYYFIDIDDDVRLSAIPK
jgi:hypothetical protein